MHPLFLWFSGILIFIFMFHYVLFVFRVSLLALGPPGGFLCNG